MVVPTLIPKCFLEGNFWGKYLICPQYINVTLTVYIFNVFDGFLSFYFIQWKIEMKMNSRETGVKDTIVQFVK